MKKSFSEIYWLQQDVEYLSKEQEAEAVAAKDWDRLVRSMVPLVISIARKTCAQFRYEDIDTVISEGFIGLLAAIKKFDPSYSRLTTWCYNPVRWACLRVITNPQRRKRKIDPKPFSQLPEGSNLTEKLAPSHVHAIENKDLCHKVLESLSPDQKTVMSLYGHGRTFKEIAEYMGLSHQRCHQIHSAAKVTAREEIEKLGLTSL